MSEDAEMPREATMEAESYAEITRAGLPTSIPRYPRGSSAGIVPYIISVLFLILTVVAAQFLKK